MNIRMKLIQAIPVGRRTPTADAFEIYSELSCLRPENFVVNDNTCSWAILMHYFLVLCNVCSCIEVIDDNISMKLMYNVAYQRRPLLPLLLCSALSISQFLSLGSLPLLPSLLSSCHSSISSAYRNTLKWCSFCSANYCRQLIEWGRMGKQCFELQQ